MLHSKAKNIVGNELLPLKQTNKQIAKEIGLVKARLEAQEAQACYDVRVWSRIRVKKSLLESHFAK